MIDSPSGCKYPMGEGRQYSDWARRERGGACAGDWQQVESLGAKGRHKDRVALVV